MEVNARMLELVKAVWNAVEQVVDEHVKRAQAVSEPQIVDDVAAMCPDIERRRIEAVVKVWFEVEKRLERTDTPEGHLEHARELERFRAEHPMDPDTGRRSWPQ